MCKDRFAQDLFQTGKEPNFMDNADPDGETNFYEFQSQYKMDRVCALLEEAIGGIACWEFPMGYVSLS